MNRIISFSKVSSDLEITPALSPSNRCAYVKTATDHNGTSIPNSPINRLIWYVEKNITYYTVTWVFNDGVTPDKVETNVPQGTSVNSATAGKPATNPTRANYDFAGWYIGNDPLNNQTVTGNITVTAHWTPLYTVTWDPNGGNWSGSTTPVVSNRYAAGTLITSCDKPVDPIKADYNFAGWQYNGQSITGQTLPSSNITVTATWTAVTPTTYTITFVDYDDTPLPNLTESGLTFGEAISMPSTEPTRPDSGGKSYKFTGWFSTDADGRQLRPNITEVRGDETFKASYNGTDLTDGNIKIFDNIGQMKSSSKNTTRTSPFLDNITSSDIGIYWDDQNAGWFSLPMDGHGKGDSQQTLYDRMKGVDVNGSDGGISPTETSRIARAKEIFNQSSVQDSDITRKHLDINNQSYYSYGGDTIVYEHYNVHGNYIAKLNDTTVTNCVVINGQSHSSSNLIDEITFYDSNNQPTLKIKALDSWIKFVIEDYTQGPTIYPVITFRDMEQYASGVNVTKTVVGSANNGLVMAGEIHYYIGENNTTNARCGRVEVWTPNGGDCTYVLDPNDNTFTQQNNKYMTHGYVYFYQLGTNYTQKTASDVE